VLLRMQDPAEDCDGFTMLTAALCTALGVPVFIATVAADGRDPSRFSHVFPCAQLEGGNILPLDASHGSGPGWMVPIENIYRWQAWDLDGKPIDIAPAKFQGLHGSVGIDPTTLSGSTGDPSYLVNGVYQQSPGPSGSGLDLTSFFSSLFGNAAAVAKVAETPTTTITLPNGTVVSGVSPGAAGSLLGSTSLTSMLPVLGIGLAIILAMSFVGGKR
jgi:hypothetical protein